jgi:hypothetical protein
MQEKGMGLSLSIVVSSVLAVILRISSTRRLGRGTVGEGGEEGEDLWCWKQSARSRLSILDFSGIDEF